MNDEDMAHTKLAEGIRAFCSDTEKLDTLLLK
jgi:transaldolase